MKYIIILAILCIYLYYESRVFKTQSYVLKSDKIKEPIKIVMLADLHNHVYGKENDVLLEAIDKEKPDIILVAGDLIVAKPNKKLDVPIALVNKLTEKYPVYYGIGNHEYRLKIYPEQYKTMYEDYMGAIKSDNLHLLDNKHEKVVIKNTPLNIFGLEIEREYYQRLVKKSLPIDYMDGLLGKINQEEYNILLAHNPQYFKSYIKWGADLTLAGHIHGGLIRLPFLGGVASPQVEFFPKYDGGMFQEDGKTMIISRGLGTHTINIRINNRAELVSIQLTNE
ncbi:metallophosphoesterase [Konateibacter massiliensis]|uniref:metallophosphoesterase n=1 Tax=Konateibacter massiliensis TaxID=2002841 RepID=UPI001F46D7DC|nr:metallophosphoesterase [Konateibacter massiliensis]